MQAPGALWTLQPFLRSAPESAPGYSDLLPPVTVLPPWFQGPWLAPEAGPSPSE